jgi:hypothetical protein
MSSTSDPVNGTPHIIGATSGEVPRDTREVSHVIAYDVKDAALPGGPGGMKARWVWTAVTGKRAQELDARQTTWFIKGAAMAPRPPARDRERPGKWTRIHQESRLTIQCHPFLNRALSPII